MRISELVEQSGVPLATVKYYLREGLLPPGTAMTATRAEYGDEHLHRLRVIRALTGGGRAAGAGRRASCWRSSTLPMPSCSSPSGTPWPPCRPTSRGTSTRSIPEPAPLIERLGQVYDARYAAVAQLEHALRATEQAGLPISDERIAVYGEHLRAMAEFDVAQMPDAEASAAVEYAVLGTALYEPVVLALRRLAHQDVAARILNAEL